jgi:type II secretory ATPase GspE/PulE/Tfp pilus assembly ATPase PilB-like protein
MSVLSREAAAAGSGTGDAARASVALAEARPEWAVGARASGEFLSRISREFARDHLICSVGRSRSDDGTWTERLARSVATSPLVLHNVSVRLRARVETLVVDPQHLAEFIDASYGLGSAAEGATRQAGEEHADAEAAMAKELQLGLAERDLLSVEGKGRVPLLVDALLFDALGRSASDVHVQPLADRTLVRFRVDGVLYTVNRIVMGIDDVAPRAWVLANASINRIEIDDGSWRLCAWGELAHLAGATDDTV